MTQRITFNEKFNFEVTTNPLDAIRTSYIRLFSRGFKMLPNREGKRPVDSLGGNFLIKLLLYYLRNSVFNTSTMTRFGIQFLMFIMKNMLQNMYNETSSKLIH